MRKLCATATWLGTISLILHGVVCRGQGTKHKGVTATVSMILQKPIFVTNEKYLSLGMDVNLIRKRWSTFNFTSTRMLTMAKALAPAYLRLSGTDADRMIFDKNADFKKIYKSASEGTSGDLYWKLDKFSKLGEEHVEEQVKGLFPPSNFTMSGEDWDNINQFAINVGWRMIFGLNEQLRNGTVWDPTNAMELLDYSIAKGYYKNLDFQLGNEPDLYGGEKYEVPINGTELGNDVLYLRKLLNGPKYGKYFKNSMIVGPDIAQAFYQQYITDYINAAGDAISAVTWHHYYGGSELKYISNYTDPKLLDSYAFYVKLVAEAIVNSSRPSLPSWQGETSTTSSPPGSDIDMSYVAGFMLLDKMGLNAKMAVDVFVRQTFYGFWFALVDQGLHATPDYWICLLFKRLVGRQVLQTNVQLTTSDVKPGAARFYAHCTSPQAGYPKGAVTLYGMNLYDKDLYISLLKAYDVDQYLLTPGGWGGITSRFIALNGKILLMPDETDLPQLDPVALPAGDTIALPPKSLGFFILKNANASACS